MRVHGSVARERSKELRLLAEAKASSYKASRIGGRCDVVMTERNKGITEDYLSVDVSDSSIFRRARFCGELRELEGRMTAQPTNPAE